MNLFVFPKCFCSRPCFVITILPRQPNFRRVTEMMLNAPIFGSCDSPLDLNRRPETKIASLVFTISIGILPFGGFFIEFLHKINSSIEENGLNRFLSNFLPIISTPLVKSILVPKMFVSVGVSFLSICRL